VPSLAAPLNGGATNQLAVNFNWLAAADLGSGTTQYHLRVSASEGFGTVLFSSFTGATGIQLSPFTQSTYYWQVMAKDTATWSNYSTVWSVQVDTTPPPVPSPSSPADNSTTNYVTQTFAWSACTDDGPAGMSQYKLTISTDSDFSSTYYSAFTAAPSCAADLKFSATYYWRVQSLDRAQNCSSASAGWTVIIDTMAPQVPVLNVPADGFAVNGITINFSWTGADPGPSGLKDFQLQVATSATFVPVHHSSITALLSCATTFAESAYWWRVRAQDNAGNYSLYAPTAAFTVDLSSPPVTTPLSPANDTRVNTLQQTFTWSGVTDSGPAGLNNYVLSMSTDSGFGVINYSSSTKNTFAVIPFGGENIYYWKVRSFDRSGNASPDTASYSLTIDTTPPSAVSSQSGDDAWHDDASALFDVDFFDAPKLTGSGLRSAEYRIFSATTPAGAPGGDLLVSYQALFAKSLPERTSYYVQPWPVSAGAFNGMKQGFNYVFVRSSDLAGNSYEEQSYAFYIKKDTAAPVITANENAPAWENADRLRDADFADYGAGVKVASYTVYRSSDMGGTPLVTWATLFDTSPAQSLWNDAWAFNAGYALLAPGTNYISLRSADDIGNIAVSTDAFVVWKDTIPPQAVTGLAVSTGTAGSSLALR
ncbi:MAG: fibronectin type III domain-containing protein, partial [Minisyncoccota bacterium]